VTLINPLEHERIYPSTPTLCTSVQEIPDFAHYFQCPFGHIEHLLVHADCAHPANPLQDAGSQL
jgi:hypothetical protein